MSADEKPELEQVHPKPGAAALLGFLHHHSTQTKQQCGSKGTASAVPVPAMGDGSSAASAVPVAPVVLAMLPPSEAHMPGSPRWTGPLAVKHPLTPELHGPALTERELGEALRPDMNELYGHPSTDCVQLPPGHAHRLHEFTKMAAAPEHHQAVEEETPLPADAAAGDNAPAIDPHADRL